MPFLFLQSQGSVWGKGWHQGQTKGRLILCFYGNEFPAMTSHWSLAQHTLFRDSQWLLNVVLASLRKIKTAQSKYSQARRQIFRFLARPVLQTEYKFTEMVIIQTKRRYQKQSLFVILFYLEKNSKRWQRNTCYHLAWDWVFNHTQKLYPKCQSKFPLLWWWS